MTTMIDDQARYYVFGAGTADVPLSYIGVSQVQPEAGPDELAQALRESATMARSRWKSTEGDNQAFEVFEMQVCSTRQEADAARDSLKCYFTSLGINLVSAA